MIQQPQHTIISGDDRGTYMKGFHKTTAGFAAAAALAFFASGVSAAPFSVSAPATANVDTSPGSETVVNFNVADTGEIASLSINLAFDDTLDGGDVYWDNMRVVLSHAGIDVVLMDLMTDSAGPGSTLSATFQDGGADLDAALVPDGDTTGTFDPVDPLAAFTGVELSGTWTITMSDDTEPGDNTDLSLFELVGRTLDAPAAAPVPPAEPPEPVPTLPLPALVLTALGLLASARFGLRRR